MLEWVKQQGYTVGGMLATTLWAATLRRARRIACAFFRAAAIKMITTLLPCELARAVEEIDAGQAIRLIFSVDRLGRGWRSFRILRSRSPPLFASRSRSRTIATSSQRRRVQKTMSSTAIR